MKKKFYFLGIPLLLLIIGGFAVFAYSIFFTRMIRVPTGAMLNTIVPGDHIMVQRLLGEPNRGDVVMYQHAKAAERYVARIVGLPGETIQVRDNSVYINGRKLEEQRVEVELKEASYDPLVEISSEGKGPYRVFYTHYPFGKQDVATDPAGEFGTATPFKIPDKQYFVLGDNRDNSYDSRYRGPVRSELIWGKATIIFYSVKMPLQEEVRWERMFQKVQ